MIKSMTGYGKSEVSTPDGRVSVELRSVNHRYGEINIKLPRQLLALEGELRKRVSDRLKRGKIDLFVQFETVAGGAQLPQVNLLMAKAYHDAFESINHLLGIYEPVSIDLIVSQKDVLTSREVTTDLDRIAEELYTVLDSAVAGLESMRLREGEALALEISERISQISSRVEKIADRAPFAVAANTERLRERINRLLGETPLDEQRLAQEVSILADKMEITEELVRLRSHFRQFQDLMTLSEPVGRKLDFLLQELNREVNTIGSKANDAEISADVVELKSELEKVREQVQNVE